MPDQPLLWKKFKRGNQPAFTTIYHQFYSSLYFFALKATQHPEIAKECVQELFVTLWNSRQRLGDVTDIKPYLFKSLRRIIYRHTSAQSIRNSQCPIDGTELAFSPEDFLIQQENDTYRQDTLAAVLNNLPPRQREAVYLKYYEDLSYSQIAEVLQINYQSVVNLIYQAFQELKRQPDLRQLLVASE